MSDTNLLGEVTQSLIFNFRFNMGWWFFVFGFVAGWMVISVLFNMWRW